MVSIGGQRLEMPGLPAGVRTLLLVNLAIFVANVFAGGRLCEWFALSWSGIGEFYGLGALRFLTYQFTHSYGSIDHILFNMLGLYLFGGLVEESVGKRQTIRIYLWCGFAGGIVQLLLCPLLGVERAMVGASGAVFGFLAYAVCLAPNRPFWMLVTLPLWLVAAIFCAIALYNLQLQLVQKVTHGVADAAHLGGATMGVLAWKWNQGMAFVKRWCTSFTSWKQRKASLTERRHGEDLDRVLAKVKDQGLCALTKDERRVLDRASRVLREKQPIG